MRDDEAAIALSKVALLAEGVDRNQQIVDMYHEICTVALLAEGVDRNWRLHTRIS